MPTIFKQENMKFEEIRSPLEQFKLLTAMPRLHTTVQSKHMMFDVRSLNPGRYSFPYHFHRYAEEMFVIFSGTAELRTPDGIQSVGQGDIVFFEEGESGAHQLYNGSDKPCVYLDIRTTLGYDITEYPDSGKINFFPQYGIFEKSDKVDYYKGEENVDKVWKDLK